MSSIVSRRNFIKTAAIAGTGLTATLQTGSLSAFELPKPSSDLYVLSTELFEQWLQKLLALQVIDASRTEQYGGIICPSRKIVHGRVGDTIYPLMYKADLSKDSKYIDAAMLLYRWMEKHVSMPDGSWLNEPIKGSWKGTTVFSSIALGETLKNHSTLLDPAFKTELTDRLKKAGDFIYTNFSVDYGNINYPIAAGYGLSLLGEILDIPKFKQKGKDLAHQALGFMTEENGFIYGEGTPLYEKSKKGCHSVDLGYNVEESLPNLVMYGLLTKDQEVLDTAAYSMKTHMEFMLPDGGWDNSWGTRNYKWSYWGSRTSDGCHPAYALMADVDPRFYKVALRNTQLLQECTNDGLLYGGPHVLSQGIIPSVHHTFCHIKALTTILDHRKPDSKKVDVNTVILPREKIYGVRFFSDIQTWLISKGSFRATVTGYDREYKAYKNGHASGGAMSLLYHEKAGPLFAGSMNEYQLYEADNMQADNDPNSISLTPRIELTVNGIKYRNISDLSADISVKTDNNTIIITSRSKLVDKDQQNPPAGSINCVVTYQITDQHVLLTFKYDEHVYDNLIQVIFPVISKSTEQINVLSQNLVQIKKESSTVNISTNHTIKTLPVTYKGRIINFVPGFAAIPFYTDQNDVRIKITVEG